MDKPNDGGPAFPCTVQEDIDCYPRYVAGYGGMSLRDWFAGQALASMDTDGYTLTGIHRLARRAYDIADAMLAEREKERA